jgi:hypothetical protein
VKGTETPIGGVSPYNSNAIGYDYAMVIIRSFSVGDCFRWFRNGWGLAGRSRTQFTLVVGTTMLIIGGLIAIPVVGSSLAALCAPFLLVGSIFCAKSSAEKEKVEFKQLFVAFRRREVFQRVFPYVLFSYALAFINFFATREGFPLYKYNGLLLNVIECFFIFIPYLLLFTPMSFGKTAELSIRGVLQSFGSAIGVFFLATIACVMLFIPIFFFMKLMPGSSVGMEEKTSFFIIAGTWFFLVMLAISPPFLVALYLAYRHVYDTEPRALTPSVGGIPT